MAAHDQRKWFFPVHCRRFYLHPFYVFAHEKRSPFVIWLLFLYGIPKYLNNQKNASILLSWVQKVAVLRNQFDLRCKRKKVKSIVHVERLLSFDDSSFELFNQ